MWRCPIRICGGVPKIRVTCLGKLIALDPVRGEHEIKLKQFKLNQGCEDAQKAIRRIASDQKKEMSEAFDKRIGRIEKEVESKSEARDIQEKVKTAIAMGKADIEAEISDLC